MTERTTEYTLMPEPTIQVAVRLPQSLVEKIDAEKTARIIRLVFYLGVDVANADARPQWDPASRRQIVQGPGN